MGPHARCWETCLQKIGEMFRAMDNINYKAFIFEAAKITIFSAGTLNSFQVIAARFLNVLLGITVAVLITRYLWPRHSAEA